MYFEAAGQTLKGKMMIDTIHTFKPLKAGDWITEDSFGGAWGVVTDKIAHFTGAPVLGQYNLEFEEKIIQWLRANGFNECQVPIKTTFVRGPNYAAVQCFLLDENGKLVWTNCGADHRPRVQSVYEPLQFCECMVVEYSHIEYNEGPPLPFPFFGFENFQDRFRL